MNEAIGTILISIGIFTDFVGCVGLLRFPDMYTRLQAAIKCVTFGTCAMLAGYAVYKGFSAAGVKAILCLGFIVLTAPVSAHALLRGVYRSGTKPYGAAVAGRDAKDVRAEE